MMGDYVLMRLPSGGVTTVHKKNADRFKQLGYEIGGSAPSPHKQDINRSLDRFNQPGYDRDTNRKINIDYSEAIPKRSYSDNSGSIHMINDKGSMSSVNPLYADKYFKKGYRLAPGSRSVEEAKNTPVIQEIVRRNNQLKEASIREAMNDPRVGKVMRSVNNEGVLHERIFVINPKGGISNIPLSSLDKKLREGYRLGNRGIQDSGFEESFTDNSYKTNYNQNNLNPIIQALDSYKNDYEPSDMDQLIKLLIESLSR